MIVSVKPRMPKAEGEAAAPPAKEGKGAPEPPPAVGDNPFDVEPKEVVITPITPLTSTGTSRASSSRAT